MAKQPKAPGRNGFRYQECYGVIVICRNAREQQAIFDKLKRQGLTLRVVTV